MITKTQFKKIDNKGLRPYTIGKDITFEIFTDKPAIEGTKKTFLKDGVFYGEPVRARIHKHHFGNFVRHAEGNGVMVANEDKSGFYLIPMNLVSETNEHSNATGTDASTITGDATDTASTISGEIKNDINTINSNPNKKVFGFTYKQIAIIAVLLLIVRKI